ncbi:MAG: D-arabinono-1,4-lactone oxidase [Fibrobacterota bacterium]
MNTAKERRGEWVSWNGNIRHSFREMLCPKTEEEIAGIIADASSVRVVGNRYSSADIAAGTATLISLEKYRGVVSVDHGKGRITAQAGITLKELLTRIQEEGFALPSMPDIDVVTLGGAIATGTHGTGRDAQLLSEYMVSCRLVCADGVVRTVDASDEDLFNAVKVSLGLLGVYSEITLQCVPLENLNIYSAPMRDRDWLASYKALLRRHSFLRILWLPHTNRGYVIRGNYLSEDDLPAEEHGGPWYLKYRRAVSRFLYNLTVKAPFLTVAVNRIIYTFFFSRRQRKFGTLYDTTVTKSRGSALELAEWTVSRDDFDSLMRELRRELNSLRNNAFAHIPMDVRFIRADSAWLSNASGRDMVTVGCVTRNPATADQYAAFDVVERVFLKYNGRPHWAKRFKCGRATFQELYDHWDDFIALRRKMDPRGKFLNDYLHSLFA